MMALRCKRCGCQAYHVLEGKINTTGERYRCTNCACAKLADDHKNRPGDTIIRKNHAWHYADGTDH